MSLKPTKMKYPRIKETKKKKKKKKKKTKQTNTDKDPDETHISSDFG